MLRCTDRKEKSAQVCNIGLPTKVNIACVGVCVLPRQRTHTHTPHTSGNVRGNPDSIAYL